VTGQNLVIDGGTMLPSSQMDPVLEPLLALFDQAVREGFLRAQNRAMALADTDIGRLLDAMAAYRAEPVSKWLKDAQQL